jgi:putative transposase
MIGKDTIGFFIQLYKGWGNLKYRTPATPSVHLVLSIPPKYPVSEVIGTMKGQVAIRLLKEVPETRKEYWGRRFWPRGYFVSTIGVNKSIISKYVQRQEVKERQAEQLGFEY